MKRENHVIFFSYYCREYWNKFNDIVAQKLFLFIFNVYENRNIRKASLISYAHVNQVLFKLDKLLLMSESENK